jgi:hypothetical protein
MHMAPKVLLICILLEHGSIAHTTASAEQLEHSAPHFRSNVPYASTLLMPHGLEQLALHPLFDSVTTATASLCTPPPTCRCAHHAASCCGGLPYTHAYIVAMHIAPPIQLPMVAGMRLDATNCLAVTGAPRAMPMGMRNWLAMQCSKPSIANAEMGSLQQEPRYDRHHKGLQYVHPCMPGCGSWKHASTANAEIASYW